MATSPAPLVDVSVADTARYVDWTAILAGAILASAISFVLFTFGTGIGLSLTSPYPAESVNATTFTMALGLWVLCVSVSSFIAGAYLTGRLRRRIGDATEHEAEVRDAAHGLLVWAVSVLLGAFIAAWVASKTADVAASAATGASAAAAQVADQANPTSYWTDVLFRPATATAAAPATGETAAPAVPSPDTATGGTDTTGATVTAPASPSAPAASAPETTASSAEQRQAASRIMSSRITRGKLPDEDRAYLTRIIVDSTGMSEAEASARVDAAVTGLYQATEKARKFGILLTFLTAASLAIGAAAAWWAAILGGSHRDQAVDFGHFFGRRRA